MTSKLSIKDIKRKVAGEEPKPIIQNHFATLHLSKKKDDDADLEDLNRGIFSKKKRAPESPSLRKGRHLVSLLLNKKQSKEQTYKKSVNLNLGDYLRLTSLSKRSASQKDNMRAKSVQPSLSKKDISETQKSRQAIDAKQSIKIIRDETKKQLAMVHSRLQKFLDIISKSENLPQDQESLVFMCNVLHIFQDKIVQSAKFAQQLIDERKKEKNIQDLKTFKNGPSSIRKHRPNRLKNHSQASSSLLYRSIGTVCSPPMGNNDQILIK